MSETQSIIISAVIPVYQEGENLPELHSRLKEGLAACGVPWEIIYIDDGSYDKTPELLRQYATEPNVTAIRLTRNFGQHPAIAAGLDRVRGQWVLTIDADLQNDPADIPKLWEKTAQGYDLINGARLKRKEGFIRRITSRMANNMLARLTGVRLQDFSSGFKLFHLSTFTHLADYGEMRRFLGVLVAKRARNPIEVPVEHHARKRGTSKYSFFSLLYFWMDFIVSYKPRAFQVVGISGVILLVLSFFATLGYFFFRLSGYLEPSPALQVLIGVTALFGVQICFFGFLGEFILRIFQMSQGVPFFHVEHVRGPARLISDATPNDASH